MTDQQSVRQPAHPDDEYSAVQLFVESARRLQPHFVLLDQDRRAVVRICQLVQGMPLGILLAAAWMDIYSPAEIADEINRSLDFLEADLPDLPLRQRSIRAAIDHSWRMLAPLERELFQKLSIFRGSFSRHAAQQIADASSRMLQALVKKSLLQPVNQGRFSVHELLRQYAGEKLASSTDIDIQVHARHSIYFANLTEGWSDALKDERQQQTLHEMDADSQNMQIAWRWLIGQEDLDRQLAMIHGMCQFYLWRGRYQEGEDAVGLALKRLAFVRNRDDLVTNARLYTLLLIWQTHFLRLLGMSAQAQEQLEAAQHQLQSQPLVGEETTGEQAFALLQWGHLLRETERLQAQRSYEESLTLYRASGDQWGMANALVALGWLIQHFGAYDDARVLYQESLAIRRTIRDQRGIAASLRALGGIMLYQGKHSEAEQLIRQSIAIAGEMDDQAGIAAGLGKLGESLTLLGRPQEAIDPLEESIAIYHALGLQNEEMFAHAVLAHALIHLGDYPHAYDCAQPADDYFQATASQRGIAYTQLIQGWALLAQGKVMPADERLAVSAHIYREIGQLDELGQAQALLGISAYQQGDRLKAQEFYRAATETANRIQAFMPLTLASTLALLLSYKQGVDSQLAMGAETETRNTDHPLVTNSRWFADLHTYITP